MKARGEVTGRSGAAGWRNKVAYIAIRNAAVLPVPVCAWPATSRPASAMGRVWAWIGVQRSNPASAMPRASGSGKWRLEKLKALTGVDWLTDVSLAGQARLAKRAGTG